MKLFKIVFMIVAWISLGVVLATAAPNPNIVNILVDDMGYSDVGCYGGEINTPNIDALAAEGIRFSTYRTYPKCSPTRNAMLLGVESMPVTQKLRNSINVAEVLKLNGYQCFYVGKVHGYLRGPEFLHQRGFDRSFGNWTGGNFFDHTLRQCYLDGEEWHTNKTFYKTDVQTDFALEFMEASKKSGKPFFLNLSYHAPHFPIQAKPEDIAKYKGQYRDLPQVYRRQRFERLQELGLVNRSWQLPPPVDAEEQWSQLSEEDREKFALVMQAYAGMVDNVDQNIGRVIAKLKKIEVYDNTLIMFSSDNGSTPECGKGKGALFPGALKERFGRTYDKDAPIGSGESHWGIGAAWANVSNTPYRKFKVWCHEGGLASPLIVHFPGKIANPGSVDHTPVFVWDFFPTWLEVAEASYPQQHDTRTLRRLIGDSLVPLLSGRELEEQDREVHFTMGKSSAYIKGRWKIVKARDAQNPDTVPWELYDLESDRTETNDLAASKPQKLQQMKASLRRHMEQEKINEKIKGQTE